MSPNDNFKRHKKHIGKASLDGFISPEGFKRRTGSLGFGDKTKDITEQTDKLDDFSRPDGYHPTVTKVAGSEDQTPMLPNGPRMRRSKSGLESDLVIPKQAGKKRRKWLKRPQSWPRFFKKTALIL